MTSGTNYRWVTALIAALVVGLVAAIVTPRFGDSDGVDWLVTIALAVLAGALVALATREKTDDGAHIKDDVLP
ncbi:hypothetical protein [Rubrivirga marina]|uniref:Uncharacterized protein n=1 Tax=Rubrivirga marina TaxID=1196024 RepID=A0A271J119_9BACT|nr:hypothetical protein [Rubrivirga marina]PAP77007.1 hypothetical protein BSZ37_11460 [Rubrivirga marina]